MIILIAFILFFSKNLPSYPTDERRRGKINEMVKRINRTNINSSEWKIERGF